MGGLLFLSISIGNSLFIGDKINSIRFEIDAGDK